MIPEKMADCSSIYDFIMAFNAKRRANKDKWICVKCNVMDVTVTIKSFNTWIQILRFANVNTSSAMDMRVVDMNQWLIETLDEKIPA